MALKFRYYFGGQPYEYNGKLDTIDEEEYVYEADSQDAQDYILRTRDAKEIVTDYIDSGLYDQLSDDDKEILADYEGFDGTVESLNNISDETLELLAEEVIITLLDDSDIYEDELQDYFEQDAYDEWESTL